MNYIDRLRANVDEKQCTFMFSINRHMVNRFTSVHICTLHRPIVHHINLHHPKSSRSLDTSVLGLSVSQSELRAKC